MAEFWISVFKMKRIWIFVYEIFTFFYVLCIKITSYDAVCFICQWIYFYESLLTLFEEKILLKRNLRQFDYSNVSICLFFQTSDVNEIFCAAFDKKWYTY